MSSKEEKAGYIKLYTYFYQRHRIGVVGNCSAGVKDMYILPLASQEMIPQELQPLPGFFAFLVDIGFSYIVYANIYITVVSIKMKCFLFLFFCS